jgi:hypothetical protein
LTPISINRKNEKQLFREELCISSSTVVTHCKESPPARGFQAVARTPAQEFSFPLNGNFSFLALTKGQEGETTHEHFFKAMAAQKAVTGASGP